GGPGSGKKTASEVVGVVPSSQFPGVFHVPVPAVLVQVSAARAAEAPASTAAAAAATMERTLRPRDPDAFARARSRRVDIITTQALHDLADSFDLPDARQQVYPI